MDETLWDEEKLASAVYFLIQGNEVEAAETLLSCSKIEIDREPLSGRWSILLFCSRSAYNTLNENSLVSESVTNAFQAVLPENEHGYTSVRLVIKAETIALREDWRKELKELLQNPLPINQAINAQSVHIWNGLRFRSKPEVMIAEALDRAKLLFFPNSICRINSDPNIQPQTRFNKEPDFLVFFNGKWGILEVDGRAYHPSAAEDHQRDRLFEYEGIKVHRFPATECMQTPDIVVKKFLKLLKAV